MNKLVEQCYAHLFFFFFSFQIFSPSFGGRTLYLEYLIIVINPFFWFWVSRLKIPRRVLVAFLAAVFFVSFYPIAAIKFIILLIGVMFLVYCYNRKLFFLKIYVYISVAVAVTQFTLIMIGKSGLAYSIGPGQLASLIWGGHAAQTFTNFYTIFIFPRVSGLSREAGFFASFLITAYAALLINYSIKNKSLSKKDNTIFVAGYVLSFSKISLAAPAAAVIFFFRRFVDYIPLIFIGAAFLAALVVFWNKFEAVLFLQGNGTFLGRLGAYALISKLNFHQLLFGVNDIAEINSLLASRISSLGYTQLYGLGGWVVQNGAIAFALYMFALQLFGIRGSGFLFILLMTATVGIDTNQNFCILAYYVGFMLSKASRLRSRKKLSTSLLLPSQRYRRTVSQNH